MKNGMVMPHDERLSWNGAISLQQADGGVMPWRLPHTDLDLFPFDALRDSAAMPSGVCLRFSADAQALTLHTEPMAESGVIDLCIGRETMSVPFAQGSTAIAFGDLPGRMTHIEVWLHQGTPFRLRGIELSGGERLERWVDDRPKWVVYGSSITFCKRTDSPSLSWPCIVARHLGLHLTNLGFGGQCHLDPMIIRLMRDLPADLVTVEAGINIYGQSSLGERTFLPALLGAIATIREGHPTCPFFVASPIYSPARETTPNAVGLTLQAIRAYTAKAVRIFRQRGDLHLHYVDGLDLFGPDMERHLVDGLHPGPEGNLRLADNVERALRIEEW